MFTKRRAMNTIHHFDEKSAIDKPHNYQPTMYLPTTGIFSIVHDTTNEVT